MSVLALLQAAADSTSPGAVARLLEFFDLDRPGRVVLVVFGLAGQLVFFMRWIVQWIASERRGRSHIPELFWWCSLAGATMLLIYFVLDRDLVGIVGQSVGWAIYGRNLQMIRKAERKQERGAGDRVSRGR